MSSIRVLAFSSSRVGSSGYLEVASPIIKSFLGDGPLNIAFVPFATADNKYDEYGEMVRNGLKDLQHSINIVKPGNAKTTVGDSDIIMVGGGNTFKLLHDIYDLDLYELIKEKVTTGTPYVGWSAGSNITGLTIGTTNDMPIIEPRSFKAFGFLPFQINPHYINMITEGHNGETRDQRLSEFMKVNPGTKIVGLPEGTALRLEGEKLTLIGECAAVLFNEQENKEVIKKEIRAGDDISYLL